MIEPTRLESLTDQLQRFVADPLGKFINGQGGTLPEQTNLIMETFNSVENLIKEFRRLSLKQRLDGKRDV